MRHPARRTSLTALLAYALPQQQSVSFHCLSRLALFALAKLTANKTGALLFLGVIPPSRFFLAAVQRPLESRVVAIAPGGSFGDDVDLRPRS